MNEANGIQFKPKGFWGMMGHQSAILMPVLFFALLWLIGGYLNKYVIRGRPLPAPSLFLLSFFLSLFLLFLGVSFFYWVKLNWMMPAYISGILLISMYLPSNWVHYQLLCSLIVHFAIAVEILFYPFPVYSDDTWFGWKTLSTEVNRLRDNYPGAFVFSADEYKSERNVICEIFNT